MRRLIAVVPVALLMALGACGGGSSDLGGGGTTPTPPTSGSNVATLTVDAGPAENSVNTPFVTVTVCSPGSTTNCQTVDHIEVDTGSYGLRIISSALASTFVLPFEMDPSNNTIVECTVFADGISWAMPTSRPLLLTVQAAA